MGEAEAESHSTGCSVSLMCLEDGADLDGSGSAESVYPLALLYSEATVAEEDEDEYMGHLLSKEAGFCCRSPASSPASSSSPAFSGISEEEPSAVAASEEWFCGARRDTVKWILETRGYFGFACRTAYLAVAYLDRFCLHRCFDSSAAPWAARLLAVACVSLAAKMEEYRAPALPELRAGDGDGDGFGFSFSCASVRRMELLVLSTLGWRMGGVTPFDYLPCLLRRVLGGGGGALVAAQAAALVFAAAKAASVVDYRPSAVAVAAVLAATHGGSLTRETLESETSSLSPSCLLDKEDVYGCYSLMLSSSSPAAAPAKRPPPPPSPSSESTGAGSTYDPGDDVAAASPSNSSSKRTRLAPPPPPAAVLR